MTPSITIARIGLAEHPVAVDADEGCLDGLACRVRLPGRSGLTGRPADGCLRLHAVECVVARAPACRDGGSAPLHIKRAARRHERPARQRVVDTAVVGRLQSLSPIGGSAIVHVRLGGVVWHPDSPEDPIWIGVDAEIVLVGLILMQRIRVDVESDETEGSFVTLAVIAGVGALHKALIGVEEETGPRPCSVGHSAGPGDCGDGDYSLEVVDSRELIPGEWKLNMERRCG